MFENLCINIIQQNDFINTCVVCWVAKFMSQSHSCASSAHGQFCDSQISCKSGISRHVRFMGRRYQTYLNHPVTKKSLRIWSIFLRFALSTANNLACIQFFKFKNAELWRVANVARKKQWLEPCKEQLGPYWQTRKRPHQTNSRRRHQTRLAQVRVQNVINQVCITLHSVLYKYWGIKLHLYEYLSISYFT
jgi:hypothetical protein